LVTEPVVRAAGFSAPPAGLPERAGPEQVSVRQLELDIAAAPLLVHFEDELFLLRDGKLLEDVNLFKKVNGIQPQAIKTPVPAFYE
jgi:hypothetical protein